MKACILTNYGSPEFFELRELPKPRPQDNQVLIKVHASSVNSWDWEILMGKPFVNRLMVGLRKPTKIKILGCDISGRIEAVGRNVKQFQPGDEVFGDISRYDLIALAFAGWLIGLAVGRDVPGSGYGMWKPWLAVLLTAIGFVSIHALGTMLFAGSLATTADLLLVPTTLPQIAVLFGLGLWVGVMYVVFRAALPYHKTWVWVAFFAFGVFGHCWTLFHVFFVIEFAEVLPVVLFVGLIGATGVFIGVITYERFACGRRLVD